MRALVFSLASLITIGGTAQADEWHKLETPTGLQARAGQCFGSFGSVGILYGGRDNQVGFRDTWKLAAGEGPLSFVWTLVHPQGPVPDTSFAAGCGVLGRKLYVVGGFTAQFGLLGGVWSYDVDANRWSKESESGDLPPQLWGQKVVVDKAAGKLYVSGGSGALGPDDALRSWSSQTGAWKLESCPAAAPGTFARYGHQGEIFDLGDGIFRERKILLWGGEGLAGLRSDGAAYVPGAYCNNFTRNVLGAPPSAWAGLGRAGTRVFEFGGDQVGGLSDEVRSYDVGTRYGIEGIIRGVVHKEHSPMLRAAKELSVDFRAIDIGNGANAPLSGAMAASKTPRAGFVTFGGRTAAGFSNETWLYVSDVPATDESPDQILATVAHLKGKSAVFTSLLHAYLDRDQPTPVKVTYTPRRDIGGTPRTTTVTLQPGEMLTVDDPLATWFGLGALERGVGSLMFELPDGSPFDLMVQSIITARNTDGTEYGQFLRAIPRFFAVPEGLTAHFTTTTDAQRNRVNFACLGLVDGTRVAVRPVDRLGNALAAAKTYDLDRGGNLQINDVHREFGLSYQANLIIEMEVIAGIAEGYESVLDGNISYVGTSDPTTIPWAGFGSARIVFLEVGPVSGLNDFTGSAQVVNHSDTQATIKADFHERGLPGLAASTSLTIPPRGTVGFQDVVGELFGLTNKVGTVVLTTENATVISGAAREYAVFRDGQGAVVGTAGQLMAGLTDVDLLQPAATHNLLGLRQTGKTAGKQRSHLAAFNPGSTDVTVTATLYDGATGASEGEKSWTVRAGELLRVNFVLSAINVAVDSGEKRLSITVTGPIFLNAFRLNEGGDPSTITAFSG